MTQIYGKVESAKDIRRINCIIRDEMLNVESIEQLTDLKKRSDYLCTLTYSPFWKKKFGSLIEEIRQVALEENRITVRLANYICKYRNWNKKYDPWGKENPDINKALQELPKEVFEEIGETATTLILLPKILEEIRKSYCRIRAAMIISQTESQLILLKHQADALKAIVLTDEFKERFEEVYDKVLKLVEEEENRTIKLANIIAEIRNYGTYYEKWTVDNIPDDESLEEYIENLLKEEEKSSTYIPTEAKYRQGIVYWIVYKHPTRDRFYAKRVYFSGIIKDLEMEGPDWFENKFGKKVYGVKFTYKTYVRPTKIYRNNLEITLPARWVKKSKVVELPEGVTSVEFKEERPDFAYPVA